MRVGIPQYKVSMDLVGPLKPSKEGNHRYILTIMDNFTRFFTAVAIENKEAETVAKAFLKHYIAVFGCPVQILTDNGSEFTNKDLRDVLKVLDIEHRYCPRQ